MLKIAGLLLMVGLAQAMIQGFLYFDNGYWSSFTIRQMLAEFNLRVGYLPVPELDVAFDWLLDREFSLMLIGVGLVLALSAPLARLFDACQAARSMTQMRRQHGRSPLGDPLATHR